MNNPSEPLKLNNNYTRKYDTLYENMAYIKSYLEKVSESKHGMSHLNVEFLLEDVNSFLEE